MQGKIIVKNISNKKINVMCKSREPNEIFEITLPKTNKWTSDSYLLSPVYEISNLITYGYIEVISIEDIKKEKEVCNKSETPINKSYRLLGEYGFMQPVR